MSKFLLRNAVVTSMRASQTNGFTFIELLVALAVSAILLSVAVPSFKTMIDNQRLQSVIGPLSLSTASARSESAKSGDAITVCARASDTQCGSNWNNGVLVFRDGDYARGEATAVVSPTDEIIRIVPAHNSGVTLSAIASNNRTASGEYTPNYVRYEPDGRANWKNGTFYACDSRGNTHANALHISISGSIRTARRPRSDTDNAVKDVFGRALPCT